MPIERTLSIVKPDGVGRNLIGEVYRRFEQAGLRVVAARMMHLSQAEAEGFYAVHRERPFFKDLVRFMTSGPVMVQVLEGQESRRDGRHGPKEGGQGHHSRRSGHQHRREHRPWIGCAGHCGAGNQLLLPRN
jgi:hypothetical protein